MRRLALVGALLLAAAAGPTPGGDPDWPCVQRLVPRLTVGALWDGPPPEGEWQAVPPVAALVERIAPRGIPESDGIAAIEAFAAPLDPPARRRALPLVFAGALEESNRLRDATIVQLRRVARRQHDLAERVRQLEAELRHADPAARDDLEQRRFFLAKTFVDAERTLRYACEAPVRLEARLGAYARALAAALPAD